MLGTASSEFEVGDVVLARNADMILSQEVHGVKFHFLHESSVIASVEE